MLLLHEISDFLLLLFGSSPHTFIELSVDFNSFKLSNAGEIFTLLIEIQFSKCLLWNLVFLYIQFKI